MKPGSAVRRHRAALLTLAFSALLAGNSPAAPVPAATRIRMSGAETLIPQLAMGLGYFWQEGLEVTPARVEDFAPHDHLIAEVLNRGHIEAAVDWYHRVLFGAGNAAPTQAVILLSDTPGMTVMVAKRMKHQIRSAADFKDRRIAAGAGYSGKSYLTRHLASRAGLPSGSYTPVAIESGGRLEAVVKALQEGQVDVMTFDEPMTSSIMETGMVTPLYDLATKEGTRKALGDLWPTYCVFLAPAYIEANPETVQRLVNAFVRTMGFVNTHTAEEIADKLPPRFFRGKERKAALEAIRKAMPTFTKGSHAFSRSAVQVVADAVFTSEFDQSAEGRYRANAKNARAQLDRSYTNRFVEKAMAVDATSASGAPAPYPEAAFVDALPPYQAVERLSGTIRLWGHGSLRWDFMGPLVKRWADGFRAHHPNVTIENEMVGTATAIGALYAGVGDVAILGEEILPAHVAAFERVLGYPPLGVEIATGSLDVWNMDYAHVFFVHRDNPLEHLTLAQLDGIFGSEHRRGPANVRTWDQVGLTGEWAGKRIHPYGWPIDDDFAVYLEDTLLAGSHRWNNDLKGLPHINRPDGSIYDHGQRIVDALSADRFGIAVSNLRYAYRNPGVKPLALATSEAGPFYEANRANLISRKYPFTRIIPAYVNRAPGRSLDPKVREFLRYLLSREGQQDLVRHGGYLPLGEPAIREQLEKLE